MKNIDIKQVIVGPIRTNCYIVKEKNRKEAVIIDPGAEADKIQQELTKMDCTLSAILLTHGHFDHIGAVDDLKKKWNCPVYCCEAEKEVMEDEHLNLSSVFGEAFTVKPDGMLKDGQVLELAGISFRVIATPGHTKGGCCYYVADEGVLFAGDTMFHGSHGRTDFPTGSEGMIIRSIQTLLTLPPDTTVLPGHEGATSILDEEKWY